MPSTSMVFSLSSVSKDSKLATARIARFVAKELKLPLVTDESVAECTDTLILINGPGLYIKHVDELSKAIRTAKKMVWVENDYSIIPPNAMSPGAQSTYRAAWRIRQQSGLPLATFWSTVRRNNGPRNIHPHVYVNWNQLTAYPNF